MNLIDKNLVDKKDNTLLIEICVSFKNFLIQMHFSYTILKYIFLIPV